MKKIMLFLAMTSILSACQPNYTGKYIEIGDTLTEYEKECFKENEIPYKYEKGNCISQKMHLIQQSTLVHKKKLADNLQAFHVTKNEYLISLQILKGRCHFFECHCRFHES
ncbi:putative lipoprotein YvzJ [Bacillus subtilis]|nr:putative lipoprotein YvzJ [Bacillus subtilis]